MSLKKLIVFGVMAAYLYTLVFDIFMTNIFRIPSPMVLGLLLTLFVKAPMQPFAYYKETALIIVAMFLYDIVGQGDYTGFFASVIVVVTCVLYFNYFVGLNRRRFNTSVIVVFAVLALSMMIMVLDHIYPGIIDPLRSRMLDDQVKQSPAGLAITQFTFGYQVTAFTAFVFVLTFTFRLNVVIKILTFCICVICLYLGMNRSAFVSFTGAVVVFLFIYYRFKAVIFVAAAALMCFAIYTYFLKDNMDSKNNILTKNEAKQANDYNRANMAIENLKVYADYPFGLIFYGKSWEEVTYRNPLFTFGLSSHNAYLMFFTYLGPFLSLGLLGAIYYRIVRLFRETIKHIRLKDNALLLPLFFSLIAISLNALSHNAWLVSADGPTLFLYFAILQSAKITENEYSEATVDEQTISEMA